MLFYSEICSITNNLWFYIYQEDIFSRVQPKINNFFHCFFTDKEWAHLSNIGKRKGEEKWLTEESWAGRKVWDLIIEQKHNKSLNHRKQKHKTFRARSFQVFFSEKEHPRWKKKTKPTIQFNYSALNDGDESNVILSKFENFPQVKSLFFSSSCFRLSKSPPYHPSTHDSTAFAQTHSRLSIVQQ